MLTVCVLFVLLRIVVFFVICDLIGIGWFYLAVVIWLLFACFGLFRIRVGLSGLGFGWHLLFLSFTGLIWFGNSFKIKKMFGSTIMFGWFVIDVCCFDLF